jgi:hypothetical protein
MSEAGMAKKAESVEKPPRGSEKIVGIANNSESSHIERGENSLCWAL